MQIHRYGYGIGGFGRFSDYGLRFLVMVSEKAQDRYRALQFWEKYGLEATKEAFKVKRRTLYNWRKQLREGNEDIGSRNEKSRAPRKRRKRLWAKEVYEEIRRLRAMHPNLSKEKLYPFVKVFCETKKLSFPKPRTIGRLIADAPDKMRSGPVKLGPKGQRLERKKSPKGRKPKGYKAAAPGECGAFDTVEYFWMVSGDTSSRLPITTRASLLPGQPKAMRLWPPENSSVSSLKFFPIRFNRCSPIMALSS